MQIYDNLLEAPSNFATFFCVSSLSARPSQPLFSSPVFVYLSNYQYFSLKNHATPPFAVFPDSRWDRYLGMTAAMTQVPVPTATSVIDHPQRPTCHQNRNFASVHSSTITSGRRSFRYCESSSLTVGWSWRSCSLSHLLTHWQIS